jgi:hypothetical protein
MALFANFMMLLNIPRHIKMNSMGAKPPAGQYATKACIARAVESHIMLGLVMRRE